MHAKWLNTQQMPAAVVTSQQHLKVQKLITTTSNKRGISDPAVLYNVGQLPRQADVHCEPKASPPATESLSH